MGRQPVEILLYCMFAKKAERRRTKYTFQHLVFSPKCGELQSTWMMFKCEYFQGSQTQLKEVEPLSKYQCGAIFA